MYGTMSTVHHSGFSIEREVKRSTQYTEVGVSLN